MNRKPIYVESIIDTDIEKLWAYTQEPEYHQQWDLRFSEINYLPKEREDEPQKFLYKTNIGFGLTIAGEGESVKSVAGKNGERTSALKFWSDQKLSLISSGRGYWQYTPVKGGIQFRTKYDYETRFGTVGRVFDQFIFRPLMGWATAWSFDCLRLWLEKSIHPVSLIKHALVHWVIRFVVAFVWIYQGLVPKLLFPQSGELQLLQNAGLFDGNEIMVLCVLGAAEILFGLVVLFWSKRWMYVIQVIALLILTFSSIQVGPSAWLGPFNLVTLNILLISLSIIYMAIDSLVPKASHCRRKPGARREGNEPDEINL